MRIFIINLKRSQGRRALIEQRLQSLGLEYEFFEGIDGYQLTQAELDTYIDPLNEYHRKFKPGEVGCFLSHYYLLKKIADENISHALIMEDDVEFSKKLPQLLSQLDKLVTPGQVIHLYSSFPQPSRLTYDSQINVNYNFLVPKIGTLVAGTVAYIVTLEAARNMADTLLPMENVIDDWMFWKQKGLVKDLKIVFPHPIDLTDNYSDIHEFYGGFLLKVKKFLIINRVPFLSDLVLRKRKKERWTERKKLIVIDGKNPEQIFF